MLQCSLQGRLTDNITNSQNRISIAISENILKIANLKMKVSDRKLHLITFDVFFKTPQKFYWRLQNLKFRLISISCGVTFFKTLTVFKNLWYLNFWGLDSIFSCDSLSALIKPLLVWNFYWKCSARAALLVSLFFKLRMIRNFKSRPNTWSSLH